MQHYVPMYVAILMLYTCFFWILYIGQYFYHNSSDAL